MSFTSEQRRNNVLTNEGQILALSGNHGAANAAEYARCAVDGAMNALVRLEGVKAASTFAFGVADRVAGGIREPTPIFVRPDPPVDETDEPADADPAARTPVPSSDPTPETYRWCVSLALLAGVLLGKLWL